MFLLVAPEGAGADHLKALARVSRLLRDRALVEKLRATDSAEALYALVSARAGETGVGGIEWANRRLAGAGRVIDFEAAASTDPAQERYLRQSLGVFGGAYYSQMAEMNLFTENRHGIQVATKDLGRTGYESVAEMNGDEDLKRRI